MSKEFKGVADVLMRAVDPYYSWKNEGVGLKKSSKGRLSGIGNNIKKDIKDENRDLQARGKNPIGVVTQSEPFFQVNQLKGLPADGEMWYYHDKKMIGVFAKVGVGGLERFDGQGFRRGRNDKVDIYPKYIADNLANGKSKNSGLPKNKWVDATHLIPFGFHGMENDPRLMVQWLQKQNQVEMNQFEQEVKKLNFSVYWMTLIVRTDEGAKWYYKVYRSDDMALVKKLVLDWKEDLVWN